MSSVAVAGLAPDASTENTRLIVQISIVATLGGFLFGFDSGVINGTINGLQEAFHSSTAEIGFEVASMLLGCTVGAFFAGRFADYWGRRLVMIVAAVLFLLSALGAGAAPNAALFVVARLVGGFAVGAASVIAPAYIAEVAPARYRGRLATVQQIAIICGLFSAFLSNYLLASAAGGSTEVLWLDHVAWRWMFWVQVVPSSLFLGSLLFIPESPRFLVMRNREQEAQGVLARLYGASAAGGILTSISASLARDRHRPKLSDLFDRTRGRVRPIVWVGIGLAALQQFVGINVVFYYGEVLWQAVGFSESDALAINVLSGALSVAACIIAVLLIDRIGRKPLLWIGSVGMTVALAVVAWAFLHAGAGTGGNPDLSPAMGITALVAANVYVVFFNMSWGPVMWVMLGEMFPNQIRGSCLAVAGAVQWLSNFIITITFPLLLVGIGLAGTYGLYALAAALSIAFVVFCIKETRGKELEEMTE
ncbi:MAG TPA: sugar porter family MFS transporter [Oleiagrimonas sp.]|nr:sugar porter family MFS transporter [Oleiagrimonas sp.]